MIHTSNPHPGSPLLLETPERKDWQYDPDVAALKSKSIVPIQYSDSELEILSEQIMNQILPGLFLGSEHAAGKRQERLPDWNKKLSFLTEKGIKTIISCMHDPVRYFPNDFEYHSIPLQDVDDQNISQHLPTALQLIDEGIQSGGVLVHCAAGMSRSATFVVAYIMIKFQLSCNQALTFVKNKRPVVQPNPGFMKFLHNLEKEIGTGES